MVKAVTLVMLQLPAPARKPIAWIHAPSQPLMRSLLSQFQTPTAPRRVSRFFRVWVLSKLLRLADHSAYFGLAKFYLSQPFQPSTFVKLNSCFSDVNGSFTIYSNICGSKCGKRRPNYGEKNKMKGRAGARVEAFSERVVALAQPAVAI